MSIEAWPTGYDRIVLDEIDSTSAEAARRAATTPGPTWILAKHQTAARGRRGRPWTHPKGNFAATLVFKPVGAVDQLALRSFIAALALYDAFVDVTGRTEPFALKWPNDVLLNGGKVAGILLESVGQGRSAAYLAIGIGVNLAEAPAAETVEPNATRPTALSPETGTNVSPEDFLTPLAMAFARYETQFTTYGFEPIRQAWLARAARLGEQILAKTTTETFTGTFETVDNTGALVLTTPNGRKAIPAADVYF